MHKVSYNVAHLLDQLEQSKRKTGDPRFRITDAAFAEAIGISRGQAIKILTNQTRRVDFSTIEGILAFFESEGMPVTINDLFVVNPDQTARN